MQGSLPGRGQVDPGTAAFALVAFLDLHQPGLLQYGQMLGEVACGQIQHGPQKAELHSPGLVGDGEDAQSDALVNDVVESVCRMSHTPRRSARAKPMPPRSSTLGARRFRGLDVGSRRRVGRIVDGGVGDSVLPFAGVLGEG